MSKYIYIYIITCLIFLNINTNSQTKFNLSLYGGYTLPVGDLDGKFPESIGTTGKIDFLESNNLLTSSGFNIGTIIKYAVDSSGKARITGGLNYNGFAGSEDYIRPSTLIRRFKNTVNIFTVSAGLELSFTPERNVNPFIGLDITANFYSGKVVGSGDTSFVLNRKAETRFGIIGNFGVNFSINKNLNFISGVKYAVTNVMGKNTEIVNTTNQNFDIEEEGTSSTINELPLNDSEAGSNRSKTLNYIQFYLGISFNFGDKLGK